MRGRVEAGAVPTRSCAFVRQVYGNVLLDNEFCGVKIMTRPHQIFQNHISGGGDGVSDGVLRRALEHARAFGEAELAFICRCW